MEGSMICRFCLMPLDDDMNNISLTKDEQLLKMIQVVNLTVNLQISMNPIICEVCLVNLQVTNNFILKLKNTQNEIRLYAGPHSRSVDLMAMKGCQKVSEAEVCRICLQLNIANSCMGLVENSNGYLQSEPLRKMLSFCFNQMNFYLTTTAFMCNDCWGLLQLANNFKKSCVDTEEKIKIYLNRSNLRILHTTDFLELKNIVLTKKEIPDPFTDNSSDPATENNEMPYLENITMKEELPEENDIDVTDIEIQKNNFDIIEIKMEVVDHTVERDPLFSESSEDSTRQDIGIENIKYDRSTIYLQPQGNIGQHILPPGFPCPQCPHRARSKVNLEQHLHLHNINDGSKVFECEICAYISKNKYHFQRHMTIHNTPSETFDCNHCSYKATKKQYLTSHMLVHSTPEEVRIYTCPKCPYKTKRKQLLKYHLQRHKVTVSESLQCKLCSYKATRKSYLVSHMLLHKTEDVYECPECDYKARKKYNVDCHMLTHKNNTYFECYHCGYRAKRKNHLVTHLIIHNEVKAFQCELCSYKCKRKSHLISHYETCKKKKEEAGERKYKCAQCSHSSFNMRQFLRHVSNHKFKSENLSESEDPLQLSPHI